MPIPIVRPGVVLHKKDTEIYLRIVDIHYVAEMDSFTFTVSQLQGKKTSISRDTLREWLLDGTWEQVNTI